jgi:hypothetical protein
MTTRRRIAAVSDSLLFIALWLSILTGLAIASFVAFRSGRMDLCAAYAAIGVVVLGTVTWMSDVSNAVRSSPFD